MNAELVDSMGSDLTVVNAARVSFGKKKKKFTLKTSQIISKLMKIGVTLLVKIGKMYLYTKYYSYFYMSLLQRRYVFYFPLDHWPS